MLLPALIFCQEKQYKKKTDYLEADAGVFEVFDSDRTGFFNVQFQSGHHLSVLYPITGFMFNVTSGYYLYTGLALPLPVTDFLILQPSISPGYYERGDGIDLGCPFEIRSSCAILVKVKNLMQLGIEIAHLSNAGISKHNPGTETLSVVLNPTCTQESGIAISAWL